VSHRRWEPLHLTSGGNLCVSPAAGPSASHQRPEPLRLTSGRSLCVSPAQPHQPACPVTHTGGCNLIMTHTGLLSLTLANVRVTPAGVCLSPAHLCASHRLASACHRHTSLRLTCTSATHTGRNLITTHTGSASYTGKPCDSQCLVPFIIRC
jgi:hypothetical protein